MQEKVVSSFLFFIQWDTSISEGVFQVLYIFQRGTKHTLAVEVKIALSRLKFQSLCSPSFQNLICMNKFFSQKYIYIFLF